MDFVRQIEYKQDCSTIRKEPLTMKSRPAVLALGSVIAFATANAAPVASTPTFTKDIAPILQAKCQDCHREGAMAPMSLVCYEQTRPWNVKAAIAPMALMKYFRSLRWPTSTLISKIATAPAAVMTFRV
jgi:hypothetical protein